MEVALRYKLLTLSTLLAFLALVFTVDMVYPYGSISPERGKWSKCGIYFLFFWELCCDQMVLFFQLFSTDLKRFCPLHSKNVFVLVPAHLEPELELFEL